jgi:uncharacterized protein (TIGR03435 family)
MRHRLKRHFDLRQKLLLFAAVAALGQAQAPNARAQFEVASIKLSLPGCEDPLARRTRENSSPGRLSVDWQTVRNLIQQAYDFYANGRRLPVLPPNFRTDPIEGGPAWINSDSYTIEAKAEGAQRREVMEGPMLQALLENRFMLKLHCEIRQVPVYILTVARGGLKMQRVEEGSCTPLDMDKVFAPRAPGEQRPNFCGSGGIGRRGSNGMVETRANSLENFARMLGSAVDRPVVDQTGITGLFNFHLEFAPDEATPRFPLPSPDNPPGGQSIFTAIQQQLGLKLESTKGPVEVLVIDHVERPSAN